MSKADQIPEKLELDGSKYSFGLVVSSWNKEITSVLLDECKKTLHSHGVKDENIFVYEVPGSFELPIGAKWLLQKHKLNGVICLGCVIKGETPHDEYINSAVSTGLINLSLASSVPCIFGVLTTLNEEQALARANGNVGHKGKESAISALQMANLKTPATDSENKIGFL